MTADVYKEGLAPRIFISREELPDGYATLIERGLIYPESVELLIDLLKKLGIPGSSILTSDIQVRSTLEEAQVVKEVVKDREYRSLIIITSPTHTRRAWLTYKKVFEDRFPPEMLKLGNENGELNMTLLAMNTARYINGVSKKHGVITREMFPNYEIDYITNGIHLPFWISKPIRKIFVAIS